MKNIYLDYAAATPLDPRVAKVIDATAQDTFGNPISMHSVGQAARRKVEDARKMCARVLGCKDFEIIFTTGATEGNNLALFGTFYALAWGARENAHIITTAIEHTSILGPLVQLSRKGADVTVLPVSSGGIVSPDAVAKRLRKTTVLVSAMYVNNELGTIQPIRRIGNVINKFKKELGRSENDIPYFHTDASQAPRTLSISVHGLGVDLMSIDGSKIYGPKGSGLLYKKSGVSIAPLSFGAAQENGYRAGTENVPAIAGLAEALAIASTEREEEAQHLDGLKRYFIREILRIPGAVINGDTKRAVPAIVNISFAHASGERVAVELDASGVFVSPGSACLSAKAERSHVVFALGTGERRAEESIRFSFGRETTKRDITRAVQTLAHIVSRVQSYKKYSDDPVFLESDERASIRGKRIAK